MKRTLVASVLVVSLVTACSSPDTDGSNAGVNSSPPTCESGSGVRACLLPFPSNRLTVNDSSTVTGLRVAIPAEAAPVNAKGVAMDLSDQNRADGFSPSSAIVFVADGVDLAASKVPDADDIGASIDGTSPIRLENITTQESWPYWAEVDPQSQLVTIRPARLLTFGHTYRITIGDLLDTNGESVQLTESSWEFTIASSAVITGRLVTMLDDVFGELGTASPAFTIGEVTQANGVRTVDGTFQVPNYLNNDGGPGGRLTLDASDAPQLNTSSPTFDARFRCVLPESPPEPVQTIVYGHGLLGDRTEVDFFGALAPQFAVAACATDWLGMSSEDLGNLAEILADMSRFGEQADRMLMGHLAFQLLGRLVNNSFDSNPAFQDDTGASILKSDGAVFVGNSQGGILGGAATAVSTEWTRAVLGVPGVNYSLLLPRSSDWPQFQELFEAAYTDVDDRLMAIFLAQMLWDRGENAGYAQHLTTDPLPGRKAKQVLLVGAFGDHQVANVSTDVLARSIGARLHSPALAVGRATASEPFWGIDTIDSYPFEGSAYVMWDFGTPAPPSGPTPPFSPEYGSDPHGAGSSEPLVLLQALTFLLEGRLIDVCGGLACMGRQID